MNHIEDGIYKHTTKEGNYTIVSNCAFMQIGQLWINCIVYKNEQGTTFVRETKDFIQKFTKI